MKWMGWSWADYLAAPPEIVAEVIDMINEEAEAMRKLSDKYS